MAGALFAAEVLYRDPEFESEVIIPAGISSVVAYCLFCLVFGWGSLFDTPDFQFQNPLELGPYLILSLVLVATGVFYVKSFYGITKLFKKIKIPNHVKPAIGGLCTGLIGFYFPQCLAFGYGFAQKAINNELAVFGPSVVIGGAMGGAVGRVFHTIMPGVVAEPGAFVVVGMAGFFTAVSNTPISTIIFVSEMTDSYQLLLPSLLVCSVAYLASRKWTIYEKQPLNRIDSPAHAGEFFVDILQTIKVKDLLPRIRKVNLIPQDMLFVEFKRYFAKTKQHYFPVMDQNGRLNGIFSSTDIRGVLFSSEIENLVVMKDIATSDIILTTPEEDLNTVLQKFTTKNIDSLPVVETDDHGILIGMLTRREVISFYNERILEMKGQQPTSAT